MTGSFNLADLEQASIGTRFAGDLHHLASVESTMNLAAAAGLTGAPAGVWLADEQTAGRGRGGHTWHSAPGDGLYASILVTPALTLDQARLIPMATGLAVRAAVEEVTGLTLDLRWPNDLMFADLKCGGILVESTAQSAPATGLRFAVIGIGLNLNHAAFPPDLVRLATSLYLESGRQFSRESILAAILRQLDHELTTLTADPQLWTLSVLRRFRAASTWVYGKRVRVGAEDRGPGEQGSGGYLGVTRGLTPDGFLQVQDETGAIRIVLSGGVRSA